MSAPSQGPVVLIAMLKADDQMNVHTQIATYFKDEHETFGKVCVECVHGQTIIVGVCVSVVSRVELTAHKDAHFFQVDNLKAHITRLLDLHSQPNQPSPRHWCRARRSSAHCGVAEIVAAIACRVSTWLSHLPLLDVSFRSHHRGSWLF